MFRGLRALLRQGSQTQVERCPVQELKRFEGPHVIYNCRMLIVLSKGTLLLLLLLLLLLFKISLY
jgi:hypothetical protein